MFVHGGRPDEGVRRGAGRWSDGVLSHLVVELLRGVGGGRRRQPHTPVHPSSSPVQLLLQGHRLVGGRHHHQRRLVAGLVLERIAHDLPEAPAEDAVDEEVGGGVDHHEQLEHGGEVVVHRHVHGALHALDSPEDRRGHAEYQLRGLA